MAAQQISRADLDQVVRNLAKAGRPLPKELAGNPQLRSIYDETRGAAAPLRAGQAAPTGKPPRAEPKKHPAAPAPARKTSPRGGKPRGRASQERRGRGALTRTGDKIATAVPGTGGTAGGLLIAIFLYPIVLSVIQHGPAGMGMWLKAKFLNITTEPPAGAGIARPAPPTDNGAVADKPPSPLDPGWGDYIGQRAEQ